MSGNQDTFDAEQLPRWQSAANADFHEVDAEAAARPSRFPFRADINSKLALWKGPLERLEIDAIVNVSNESLTEREGVAVRIFSAAGVKLEEEVSMLEGCRTGEAKSTAAYNLSCKRIFHTVGPRYNVKYQTAAENALCSCYRFCLQLMSENHLRTIGFPCVHSERKGYPTEMAAHIAIRTVRRFLEQHSDKTDLIVLACDSNDEFQAYSRVLPLYFPRTVVEQVQALTLLPEDTGNAVGETASEERKIRISAFGRGPVSSNPRSSSLNSSVLSNSSSALAANSPLASSSSPSAASSSSGALSPRISEPSFASMRGDLDAERKVVVAQKSGRELEEEEQERAYARYLKRARNEKLDDIADLNFLLQCGVDVSGRPVVVFVGKNLPAETVDMERVLMYIIRQLEAVSEREYVVVVYLSGMESENKPELSWFRRAYGIGSRRMKRNLKAIHCLHSSFFLRAFVFLMSPFVSDNFDDKINWLSSLAQLYGYVPRAQIQVPNFVEEIDRIENDLPPQSSSGSSSQSKDSL